MEVNADAGKVVERLLAHDNDLVREATRAAYWQVAAEGLAVEQAAAIANAEAANEAEEPTNEDEADDST